MFNAVESPYRVPFKGTFKRKNTPTTPPKNGPDDKACRKRLAELVAEFDELQRILFAHDRHSILLVFQAMDGAGKDSTIRSVLSGINPAGCQVYSFKQPSFEELEHDFLWRSTVRLPERGRIGVFNRSYYENVLIVRVHPELLKDERLPEQKVKNIWQERYESIRDHEKHLARNGTVILKFWLNVSKEEQRLRLLSRIEEPEKNWKFNTADVHERERWSDYMDAYEEALSATSRAWAPWYAIPADNKHYMRVCVAEIIVKALKSLDLKYPKLGKKDKVRFKSIRKYLENEK